jgi:hypothetical protein
MAASVATPAVGLAGSLGVTKVHSPNSPLMVRSTIQRHTQHDGATPAPLAPWYRRTPARPRRHGGGVPQTMPAEYHHASSQAHRHELTEAPLTWVVIAVNTESAKLETSSSCPKRPSSSNSS